MISRRRFLQSTLTAALVPLLPRVSFGTTLKVRQDWGTFRTTPMFQVYLNAVSRMKANTNSADPSSWAYWVNVHKNFCPHSVAYFLAWHRGFLFRFEAQLRKAAANTALTIPYWDYYTTPQMPMEFTDPTSPLYIANRAGTDVTNALSLNPFADTVINFQRGLTDAFEPTLESLPHNPVHNLIGGAMGSVTISPRDPIFWVHHGNIDRLWTAWCHAGNGRTMPPRTDPYWSGSFNYGPAVATMARTWAISETGLGYQYDNEIMPTTLPPPPPPAQPAAVTLQALSSPVPGALAMSLGGGQDLALNERSVSIVVPLTQADRNQVRSLLLKQAARKVQAQADNSLRIVLTGVRLTGLGKQAGYFYKIYINLPAQPGVSQPETTYLLGTLGAFEITGKLNHLAMKGMAMSTASDGVQLVYPATDALAQIAPANLDKLIISFIRVNGSKPVKKGTVITVKEFRVETSGTAS
ncbi:tyrosinase family protein [Rhodanobacter umsongensis]|uniref:Tyrosinase family protein n=1 Tax=Rhodanobacter umsongensis TaxID=633153 RepID=A0ABW0JGR8_9GAMM